MTSGSGLREYLDLEFGGTGTACLGWSDGRIVSQCSWVSICGPPARYLPPRVGLRPDGMLALGWAPAGCSENSATRETAEGAAWPARAARVAEMAGAARAARAARSAGAAEMAGVAGGFLAIMCPFLSLWSRATPAEWLCTAGCKNKACSRTQDAGGRSRRAKNKATLRP